jgi:hypothetical protein
VTFQSLTSNIIFRGFVIGLTLFLVLFFAIFFFLMKGEPFQESIKFINSDSQINERIGSVKNISLSMWSSSYKESGTSGNAQYKINVYGEKGLGVVYVDMEKRAGVWTVIRANLLLPDKSRVILLVATDK